MNSEKNLKLYLEELDSIKPLEENEILDLIPKVVAGDDAAIKALIEGNLYIVPLRVSEFVESGINVGDLIQEGNIALMEAVDSLTDGELPEDGKYAEYFADLIDVALRAYIADESSIAMAARTMKQKANELLDATIKYEEENGEPATLEELSKILNMSKEDIETVLRASYAAMENGDISEIEN